MTDRAALLVADLERIPELLRSYAADTQGGLSMPSLVTARPRRVVLVGLGSSRFAALAVAPALRAAGLDVVVEHASTQRPAPLAPGTLLVAISNSGRTPEVVAAAARGRAAGIEVLAITNDPASPLAAAADLTMPLGAGVEASGVASVTYAATIAALTRWSEAIGAVSSANRLLAEAAGFATELLARRSSWLYAAADVLDTGSTIHVLADAGALGTAEQAALLFRECPRLGADATDTGDWLHVGIYTALPGYRAILLAGTPYDVDLVNVIHERGGRLVAIGTSVPANADFSIEFAAGHALDPLVRALVEPLAPALLAAELWRRARAVEP